MDAIDRRMNTGLIRTLRTGGRPIRALLIALCLLFPVSCSMDGGGEDPAGDGSVAFSLEFPESPWSQARQAPVYNRAVVSTDCAAYGISSIEAFVYDEEDKLIARGGPWDCVQGSGTVPEVAAGENRRIVISCRDESGAVLYSGERTGILVEEGVTADAGVIDVRSTNHAPVLANIADTSGLVTGTVDTPVVLSPSDILATDEDEDDILTYEVGGLLDGSVNFGAAFDPVTRQFSWTPNAAGDYKVLFIVHDNGTPRKSDFEEVTIHIGSEPVGEFQPQFPVLDPIGSRAVDPGDTVSIQLHAESIIEGTLEYTATNLPELSELDIWTGLFTWNPTSDDIGNHTIRFTVSNQSRTDYENVTITVGDVNRPPVLTPIGLRWASADYEAPVSFVVTAADPEDDILTYTLQEHGLQEIDAFYAYPQTAAIDPDTQVFTMYPDYPPDGDYAVRIVVTDSHGESDYEDVIIRVPLF